MVIVPLVAPPTAMMPVLEPAVPTLTVPDKVGEAEKTTLPVPVGVPTATFAILATVVAEDPAEVVTSPVNAGRRPALSVPLVILVAFVLSVVDEAESWVQFMSFFQPPREPRN